MSTTTEPLGPAEEPTTAGRPPARPSWAERPAGLVAAATALAMLSFVLPTSVRWLLTPLVMFLPGHALVCAVFGRRLEFGGVRRVCLSLLLTLATYPILALAVFSLSVPMSHLTVAVSTWLFVCGCAAVVEVRARRVASGRVTDDVPPPGTEPRIDLRQLVVPGLAILTAGLLMWGSLHVLPRRDPVAFSATAFAGPWALVKGAVDYDADRPPEVAITVRNSTPGERRYVVEPRVVAVDGSTTPWPMTTLSLPPGADRDLEVAGPVPAGQCRAKLEVHVRPDEGPALGPLTLYLRDREAVCQPSGAGR